MVNRVQDDLLLATDTVARDNSYFASLASKAGKCATVRSLKHLLNDVCDSRTALSLFGNPDKPLRFVPHPENQESGALGHLEIGQTVVEVQGDYETIISAEELQDIFTAVVGSPRNPDNHNPQEQKGNRNGQRYNQNQLPSNVNYVDKCLGCVTVVGQSDQSGNKFYPVGAAYHVKTGDIYVADPVYHRVMVYPSDGGKPRIFYTVIHPYDVAVSTDGAYGYIAAQGLLIKVDMDGENVKTIHKCSLGPLTRCLSVVGHNEFTVLVDRDWRSVILFDESCKEVRLFGQTQLRDPTAVAISADGEMFVTDNADRSIEVFKWNGEFVETFLSYDAKEDDETNGGEENAEKGGEEEAEDEEVSGQEADEGDIQAYGEVAVDGDGFICVTNRMINTIDIYDRQKNLLTRISRSGKLPGQLTSPFRLTLLPDGRMMVTDIISSDPSIDRLQIF